MARRNPQVAASIVIRLQKKTYWCG